MKKLKDKKKIIISGFLIILLVFTIFFLNKKEQDALGIVTHYYKDGVQVFPEIKTLSMVYPMGIEFTHFKFEIIARNNGNVDIENLKIEDAYPIPLKDALPSTIQNLDIGQTKSLWMSELIEVSQFESYSQPVRFNIKVSAEDIFGEKIYHEKYIDLTIKPTEITYIETFDSNNFEDTSIADRMIWGGGSLSHTGNWIVDFNFDNDIGFGGCWGWNDGEVTEGELLFSRVYGTYYDTQRSWKGGKVCSGDSYSFDFGVSNADYTNYIEQFLTIGGDRFDAGTIRFHYTTSGNRFITKGSLWWTGSGWTSSVVSCGSGGAFNKGYWVKVNKISKHVSTNWCSGDIGSYETTDNLYAFSIGNTIADVSMDNFWSANKFFKPYQCSQSLSVLDSDSPYNKIYTSINGGVNNVLYISTDEGSSWNKMIWGTNEISMTNNLRWKLCNTQKNLLLDNKVDSLTLKTQ